MIYIVTGATSFIGLELIEYLLSNGHSVIAVCRPNSMGLSSIPKGVKVVISEMADYCNLHNGIKRADVFINLAWAGTGHDGRNMADVQNDNIRYTLDAMISASWIGCKLFIEAGSQAEYGSTTEYQSEDMECNPFSEYGKAKLSVKEKAFALSEELHIKYLHLRIFSIFGENDHPWTLVMSAIEKMLKDETVDLSSCTQNWNFLYVKDAVKMITGLCEYAIKKQDYVHEVFNIASNDTRPLTDFVQEMKFLTNSTSKLNYGAIVSANLVSLQPDVSKTIRALDGISYTKFVDVINTIKKNKEDNRPDIFEKADNFNTYADIKSVLMFGDFDTCKRPLISVIIPVYKRPELFEESLLSVLNQDCDISYEIIVVDNNDCDGKSPNLDVVERHAAPNLYYYRHEKNIGGYGNLNRGVELARAEYVSFCHDDDLLMPHAIRTLWNLHLKYGNKCITSRHIVINEDGSIKYDYSFPSKRWKGRAIEKEAYEVTLFDQFIWPTGLDICNLYNKNCFIELGGYNPANHPSCDNAFLALYTYHYGAVVNAIPSLKYRQGDNASATLWPLFADNHLHQRKCMAKRINLPNFVLKRIYVANYHKDIVQHRVFWGKEPDTLWNTVPKNDLRILSFINKLLDLKKYKLAIFVKNTNNQ